MENGNEKLLMYDLGEGVEAFSTRKNSVLPYHVIQPHQTHSTNVAVIDRPDYTKEELRESMHLSRIFQELPSESGRLIVSRSFYMTLCAGLSVLPIAAGVVL